ncbi:MAG: S4 domain-containing protein, partial [Polyangiaceae bacterium]
MRLQRYLAQAGVASRRASEEMIASGRIRVNGRVVRELGTRVEDSDRIEVDGVAVKRQPLEILVLNKPVGVVTTMRDPEGRRTIADVMRECGKIIKGLVPVGRLDYDSSGVLLLTN